MRNVFRSFIFAVFGAGFLSPLLVADLLAQEPAPRAKGTPEFGGEIKKDDTQFLNFNFKEGRNSDTLNYIDKQNKAMEAGDRSSKAYQDQLTGNRAKAEEMANMIKDEELQKAFAKVTVRGKQLLQENQELKLENQALKEIVAEKELEIRVKDALLKKTKFLTKNE